MIGLDTFSWNKIFRLKKNDWNDVINEILDQTQFFVTTSSKNEYEYRFPNESEILRKVAILPDIKGETYYKFIFRGFDEADASFLEYCEIKAYRIITEDHPMLNEGVTSKNEIIQLIDFFKELYSIEFFTKREFTSLIRIFRKWKNISLKKEILLKEFLKRNSH